MNTSEPSHFLNHFYAMIKEFGEQPLLYEKRGGIFQYITYKEAATQLNSVARALYANGIMQDDRVAVQAQASPQLWIAEWGILANRAVEVIVPRSFNMEELKETLLESKSKLLLVDTLAAAKAIANIAESLPDLNHIVCFEGRNEAPLILSWGEFIDSGRRQPDRATALVRSILPKDTAIIFYYRTKDGARQATRYTHGLLFEHAQKIDSILSKASGIRQGNIILASAVWEYAISHIASCYFPLLKKAAIQLTSDSADITHLENSPDIIIGGTAYLDTLRQHVTSHVLQKGKMEYSMFVKAVALGKLKYESPKKLGLLQKAQNATLQAMVVKKIPKLLGENLRLLIGTDDSVAYETHVFFHTLGIELAEIPPEVFR